LGAESCLFHATLSCGFNHSELDNRSDPSGYLEERYLGDNSWLDRFRGGVKAT